MWSTGCDVVMKAWVAFGVQGVDTFFSLCLYRVVFVQDRDIGFE
jgi:hypothetical protein